MRGGSATRCRTIGSSSPNRASASPRSSPAGARSGSMARSSARRWCRAADPAAAARAFVAAGAVPDDPANVARRPFVKICGVTDLPGVLAAVAAGADAIGLNVVPGTPRELSLDEAADLARIARTAGTGDHRPTIVAITADAAPEHLAAIVAAVDPDVVQLAGARVDRGGPGGRTADLEGPADPAGGARRPRRAPPPTSSRAAGPTSTPASTGSCSTRPAGRTRAGPARAARSAWPPRSPARCRSSSPAACARPTSPVRCERSRRPPSTSRRASSDRATPGSRPAKDPLRVALFVKRARAARDDRPNVAVRADPGPRRPARRRRRRALGDGARLRWPLRAGDADGRARAARDAPTTPSARTRSSGPSCATCWRTSPVVRPPCTAPTAWPPPSATEAARLARDASRAAPATRPRSRTCACTSSARTSPTPARTRSTTPSARRC